MSKGKHRHKDGRVQDANGEREPKPSKTAYERALYELQIELVKLQNHIIRCNDRIIVLFEGRDAAGKDGTIKRIIEHLSPREVRVVALPKPSDREATLWYFQRYTAHLPAAQEMVLFNRSWYNRAGVERVMGFCSEAEAEAFLADAPVFEELLVRAGIKLLKYYLDISKPEQKRRLKARGKDLLTQWKSSPIDAVAVKRWKDYSRARDEMFARTHTVAAPWHVVRADDKRQARLNLIRDMLSRLDYAGKKKGAILPDPKIVFPYSEVARDAGLIAK
ncbi:MAG TPA: polyphosphate kinase 2 [Alphaproteobacteria bacterium]|nr:polyphosphate kinase 2 [Alphaproteobacteria bacterium]